MGQGTPMARTLALIGALLFVHGIMAATIPFDFNKGFSGKLADQQLTVQSGDEIVFTWTGTHNVYKMKDKAAYDACSFDGSALLGEQSGTKTTLQERPEARGHCRSDAVVNGLDVHGILDRCARDVRARRARHVSGADLRVLKVCGDARRRCAACCARGHGLLRT